MSIKPFSEVALFEQGNLTDAFYATGSSPSFGDGSFSVPLKNKAQYKVSFQVKNKVGMLSNSASLYYFNNSAGQWNIPSNAVRDHTGPFDKLCFGNYTDYTPNGTFGSYFFEDIIGFDSFGISIASGSLDVRRQDQLNYTNSIEGLGAAFDRNNQIDFLTDDYPKSVSRNFNYDASKGETFELPIKEPFLLEKIVFEIPFCLGDSWFRDKTLTNPVFVGGGSPYDYLIDGSPSAYSYSYLDQGGPRISISLFSQKNYGTASIRDLIAHDVITHVDDTEMNFASQVLLSGTIFQLWGLSTTGLDEDKSPTSFTVVASSSDGSSKFYTGSVIVKSESSITNGMKTFMVLLNNDSTIEGSTAFFRSLLENKYVETKADVTAGPVPYNANVGVDPIGRGMTGFTPSGGSIFGREFVTSQGSLLSNNKVKNPFYVSGTTKREDLISQHVSLITSNPKPQLFYTVMSMGTKTQSPYLVRPGEKFILAASKHRPAHMGFKCAIDSTDPDNVTYGRAVTFSSSYYNNLNNPMGHDVQFNTGTINITFYGSYVRENGEYRP